MTYHPGLMPSLFLNLSIGTSDSSGTDAVDNAGISGNNLNGPASWLADFQEVAASMGGEHPSFGYCFKKAPGTLYAQGQGGTPAVETVSYVIGPQDINIDPPQFGPDTSTGLDGDDSSMRFTDTWERAQLHRNDVNGWLTTPSATVAGQLEAIVEDYVSTLHRSTVGVPCLTTLGCPLRSNDSLDEDSIASLATKSMILPALLANHFIAIESGTTTAKISSVTGLKTPLYRFLDWWKDMGWAHIPILLEPGGHRTRTAKIFDDPEYAFVGGWTEIDISFDADELANNQQLVIRTDVPGVLDPRQYPSRKFLYHVDPTHCDYVSLGGTNAVQIDRLIEVANLLWDFSPNVVVSLGSLSFISSNASPSQFLSMLASARANVRWGGQVGASNSFALARRDPHGTPMKRRRRR